jgi:hypothetical protein
MGRKVRARILNFVDDEIDPSAGTSPPVGRLPRWPVGLAAAERSDRAGGFNRAEGSVNPGY